MSAFIDEHRERFGVEPICRTLGVPASAYYQHGRSCAVGPRGDDDRLLGRLREVHAAGYEADGYRRTWKALLRTGELVPRCRVQRLMRTRGIQGAKRRGKPWRTTKRDPNAQRRPDLVGRNFTADQPNRLWVGDLSYLRCWEGVVYFAFVIDVHSRRVVGWQLAGHMRTTSSSTRCAWLWAPGITGLTSGSWPTPTAAANTPRSTTPRSSTTTTRWPPSDRSGMPTLAESFLDSFKTELIADRVWRTRSQLELAVVEYLSWSNQDRLHEALGDIPPAEFETLYARRTEAIAR